jgi:hypothetical protein
MSIFKLWLIQFGFVPGSSTVEILLPDGKTEHKYSYVSVAPIPARRVERIPFSHPRQIFPLLRVSFPLSFLTRSFVNGLNLTTC